MVKAAIITVSDKGSKGQRIDETGHVLRTYLEENGYEVKYYTVIPDEEDHIEVELKYISDVLQFPLIVTNGGTGFAKRDITPEVTFKVIEKYVPGIGEIMRMKNLQKTERAILSRGICGIRKNSLIVNLPGSPRGARENLESVLPTLKHGIDILTGDAFECARK